MAAINIRPVRDEDVAALVQLALAAFVPVFRSYEKAGYVPLPLVRYFKDL
jgi:hypothetical protein